MAKLDEKQVAVARVYAQSMLDLATDEASARSLLEELTDLESVLDAQPAFAEFFTSPLVDTEVRRGALERTLRGRASDTLVDALLVMDRHGRLSLYSTVVEVFRQRCQDRFGEVDVEVTTAIPLDQASREALRASVAKVTGKSPILVETVDGALLGGMVLRFGDRKIDTSVAKDLRTMRGRLDDRAAREIHGGRLTAAAD